MRRGRFWVVTLLAGTASLPARALDIEASAGVFYFASDQERIRRAETESAEDGLKFRSPREPRSVARGLAAEELRSGNVCLRQAERDLRDALQRKQLLHLCRQLFRDDLARAVKDASREGLSPEYLRCEAGYEAREAGPALRAALSFRARLVMREPTPARLRKAGFAPPEERWSLPVREAELGSGPSAGWKEALKHGSCSLGEEALAAFLERYQRQVKEAGALALCRSRQARDSDHVLRLQKQLRDYVPDEWLRDAAGKGLGSSLEAPAAPDAQAGLTECRERRARLAAQLAGLRRLSGKIADRHDIPALDPASPAAYREPASEPEEN